MKATRKLIPAIVLLLVSAIMLSTASYAWFAVNTTVTAGNMEIKAKTETASLLINNSGTAGTGSIALSLGGEKEVLPSTFTDTALTFGAVSIPAKSWYTAHSSDPALPEQDVKDYTKIDETNEDMYLRKDTMYLTLTKTSPDYNKYIRVTISSGAGTNAAVSIVLKITHNGTTYFKYAPASTQTYIDCTTTNLTKTSTIEVVAYTYLDGKVSTVFSNADLAELKGSFNLTFDLVDVIS